MRWWVDTMSQLATVRLPRSKSKMPIGRHSPIRTAAVDQSSATITNVVPAPHTSRPAVTETTPAQYLRR
jgi:hypothetical protein